MGDGAEIGLSDELGIFGEEPALATRYRRPPRGAPYIELILSGDQVNAPVGDIDANPVAIADQRKRAADRCKTAAYGLGCARKAASGTQLVRRNFMTVGVMRCASMKSSGS